MSDNTTAHIADQYDEKVRSTIPCFENFHQQTLDLIRHCQPSPASWLDTGGGTGILIKEAVEVFPDTRFILADPAPPMLARAQVKLGTHERVTIAEPGGSGELKYTNDSFDVITAIQSHHYLDSTGRKLATANCFRMLAPGGVYVTFENIRPFTPTGIETGLRRWIDFQTDCGKPRDEAEAHAARFGHEYFPITISEHLELLRSTGFSVVEILWASYLQAGFYAVK